MAHKYTHTGEPMPKYDAASLIANAKARAEQAELSFDLTPDAVPLPDICPALGISLDYSGAGGMTENSPIIQRIDPALDFRRGDVPGVPILARSIKQATAALPARLLSIQ